MRLARRTSLLGLLIALTTLLCALPLAAQDAGEMVQIEAFVTDKHGKRILDLQKDDVELSVEGKPLAIDSFFAVEVGQAPIGEGLAAEQKLHLVVYVDNANLHPYTRNRTFPHIRTFLRTRLSAGDEVMLISYDRAVHVRHPFTSDPELIASTLYKLEELSANAVHTDADRSDILERISHAQDLPSIRPRASEYADSLYNDIGFTLRALTELVENLAGLPGRKAILYISDGLPMQPGEDIWHALDDRFSAGVAEAYSYDLSRHFQHLTDRANANRVTFYPLDAMGLRTYSYAGADEAQRGRIDQVHFGRRDFSARETAPPVRSPG